MIENNELTDVPRISGFANDVRVIKKQGYSDSAFVAVSGLTKLFNPQAAVNETKAIKNKVQAKYGAEIKTCEQAATLLTSLQLDIDRVQKQLTAAKNKAQRDPLNAEYSALVDQQTRIQQNMVKMNCDLNKEAEGNTNFTNVLSQLTGNAAAKPATGSGSSTDNTLLYVGIGAGVLVIGGLLIFALKG